MKNIARGYVRLSGRDEKERVSPEIQLHHCQQIAQEHGWTLVSYDEGAGLHSAHKRTNIPQWNKLYQDALTNGDTAAVIAYDLSRQFRNSEAFKHQVQELLKHQIRVIFSVEGEVSFDKADDVLVWGFRAEIAEYESRKTSERLKNYHQGLRDKGIYAGHRAPFGLSRVGHGNDGSLHFEPISAQMRVVISAFTLYADGIGTPTIAHNLEQSGYHWRDKKGSGRSHISTSHVKFLIDRVEHYQEFIDARLYHKVLREREKRRGRKENGPHCKQPPVLLWHLAHCAECGRRYAQSVRVRHTKMSGDRLDQRIHHLRQDGCPYSGKVIYCAKLDRQLWAWLKVHLAIPSEQIPLLADKILEPVPRPPDELDVQLRREKLARALANLPKMLAEEDISREQFLALKSDYEAQLSALHAQTPVPAPPALPKRTKPEIVELLTVLSAWELLERGYAAHPTEVNATLRNIISRVLIRSGKLEAVELIPPLDRLVID